jgi:hypothetical protein
MNALGMYLSFVFVLVSSIATILKLSLTLVALVIPTSLALRHKWLTIFR